MPKQYDVIVANTDSTWIGIALSESSYIGWRARRSGKSENTPVIHTGSMSNRYDESKYTTICNLKDIMVAMMNEYGQTRTELPDGFGDFKFGMTYDYIKLTLTDTSDITMSMNLGGGKLSLIPKGQYKGHSPLEPMSYIADLKDVLNELHKQYTGQ